MLHSFSPQPSASTSSSTSSSSSSSIPEEWQWVLSLVDEAQLPKMGLPVRWKTTQGRQIKTAFDPVTLKTIDIETGEVTLHKHSPVGFITATAGHCSMPGTDHPAAVRYARFMEPALNAHLVADVRGNVLAPCIAHGDYVQVAALQSDHVHAKTLIEERQRNLIDQLNGDRTFAKTVMSLDGMDKFFVLIESEDRYYGTLFFYELYFNDIDNVWLICSACNLHKSDQEIIQWFKEQWLYGDEFLDYLGRVKDDGILLKTQTKQGLADVAIHWFWERHANYMSVSKRLLGRVVTPIQMLNQKVDYVIGQSKRVGNTRRSERLKASLDFRLALMETVAAMSGIDMPRTASESPHSSSDESTHWEVTDEKGERVPVTVEDYRAMTQSVILEVEPQLKTLMSCAVQRKKPLDDPIEEDTGSDVKRAKFT